MKILLVEDDEKTIDTISFVLKRENFEVISAKDGNQAIEKLSGPFDLILLDLVIPLRDGFGVLKTIREEKKLQTPVVVLSNLSQDQDVQRAMNLGANDYLIKSQLSIKEILEKVKKYLS